MERELKEAVANRFCMLCFDKGKTIYEISKETKISRSTLYSISCAKYEKINLNIIVQLCMYFNISVSEFFNHSYFENLKI